MASWIGTEPGCARVDAGCEQRLEAKAVAGLVGHEREAERGGGRGHTAHCLLDPPR